ncbi:MAG: hypothetical protein D6732_29575 [Methanobacteriota archaeon]|nr:MAG: hypothetical protein D6732_29575 [Euryarchaeota archaeon]
MLGSNGYDSISYERGETSINMIKMSELIYDYPIKPETANLVKEYEQTFTFPLRFEEEVGQRLEKYNGAERINSFKTKGTGIKSPVRFRKIMEYCQQQSGITPSHGLKTNPDMNNSDSIIIPLLIEFPNGISLGVIYFDEKRSLSYTKIQKAERGIVDANLDGGLIIYNVHGMQAERELHRINEIHGRDNFLTMVRFSEIENSLY